MIHPVLARMKKVSLIFSFALLMFLPARLSGQNYRLPAGAVVIETQPLKSGAHANRALLLWMLRPGRHPRDAPDDVYSCPEETRGSYYSGPTRVSLVDTQSRQIINTLKISDEHFEEEDYFDVPYQIHDGHYHVAGVREGEQGKPVGMWLRDYNGDGQALEFAPFDALACMGLSTTLIGYSEARDRVI